MNEKQDNLFKVSFDGTVEDLVAHLEAAGFQVVRNGNKVIIEKTPEHEALDESCGYCDKPCGQPWCPTKRKTDEGS